MLEPLAGSCGYDVHPGHREWDRLISEYSALTDAEKDERGYERNLWDVLARLTQRLDMTISRNREIVEKDNQPRPIKAVDQARLDALKQQEQGSIPNIAELAARRHDLVSQHALTVTLLLCCACNSVACSHPLCPSSSRGKRIMLYRCASSLKNLALCVCTWKRERRLHAEAIEQSDALAEAGDADGIVAMTEKAARLKEEHDTLRLELVTPERTKAVCEVCGVFTNSNDNEQRKEVRHALFNNQVTLSQTRLVRCRILPSVTAKLRGS